MILRFSIIRKKRKGVFDINSSNILKNTGITCTQCGSLLVFDGIGCFCVNKNCIVYDKYVLYLDEKDEFKDVV